MLSTCFFVPSLSPFFLIELLFSFPVSPKLSARGSALVELHSGVLAHYARDYLMNREHSSFLKVLFVFLLLVMKLNLFFEEIRQSRKY